MATLSGRQQARQQTTPKVNNGVLVAAEGSAAAVAECKLELVQQRTGLCVEEARYCLDDLPLTTHYALLTDPSFLHPASYSLLTTTHSPLFTRRATTSTTRKTYP